MPTGTSTAIIYQFGSAQRSGTGAAESPRPSAGSTRSVCRERLFVQVILCGSQPALVGRTWSCRTVAVSDHQIEFLCDHELPGDALIDLWVDLADRPGKFFLSGRVHGSQRVEDGRYAIDIELEDGAATDIAAWCALLT